MNTQLHNVEQIRNKNAVWCLKYKPQRKMFEESVNARYTCTTQCCNLPIKAEPNVEFFDIHSLHFSNLVRTYEYRHSSYIRKHNSTLFFFVSHETNRQGLANAKRCCISSWLQSFFLWERKWGQNLRETSQYEELSCIPEFNALSGAFFKATRNGYHSNEYEKVQNPFDCP